MLPPVKFAVCPECGNEDLKWPGPGAVVRHGANFNLETDAYCPMCEWYGDPDVDPNREGAL